MKRQKKVGKKIMCMALSEERLPKYKQRARHNQLVSDQCPLIYLHKKEGALNAGWGGVLANQPAQEFVMRQV